MNQNKELKNMSEYLKSVEPNDAHRYIKKLTLATVEFYLIHMPWLLKIGKTISTSFQVLPGTMSQSQKQPPEVFCKKRCS